VDVLLPIGDFSKMTYLTVKALRHYHDVGLLEPAATDPVTGYRRYAASQVATAQAIRRFRDLGMPIAEVRAVLQADDLAARNRAILSHLERMHGPWSGRRSPWRLSKRCLWPSWTHRPMSMCAVSL
jgi:DNA-binding transcriptional MerR regulator